MLHPANNLEYCRRGIKVQIKDYLMKPKLK